MQIFSRGLAQHVNESKSKKDEETRTNLKSVTLKRKPSDQLFSHTCCCQIVTTTNGFINMITRLSTALLPSIRSIRRVNRSLVLTAERGFSRTVPPSSDGDDAESKTTSGQDDRSLPVDTVLFPWRHKTEPVPRLIPGTPEHKKVGLLLTSKSQKVYGNSSLNAIATAYMFLNVPWYELLWISHYKDELATDMSWSFTQGVASLLSNLPLSGGGDHIPWDRIITDRDDGVSEIDFCETIEISRKGEGEAFRIELENDSVNNDDGQSEKIPIRKIFEQKAIDLYNSSVNEIGNRSEKERFELCLKMIPRDFKFVTLYAIPYLSRRNAKSDPELLTFYGKMLKEESSKRAPYLSKLRQDHLENNGYMESTIIAQCLVWCDELFYVKNLSTGEIIQGKDSSTEMQRTPHLVRMERTVVTKKDQATGKFDNLQEDWIITDIDDLLGGNLVI